MCFRPSALSAEKKCPSCGTTAGPTDTTCPKCGAALPNTPMPGAGAPSVPGAPKAPGAPAAPAAPKAPKAPGAPQK